jgi:transcriptional regulator of acetoin/glycerol metabolism
MVVAKGALIDESDLSFPSAGEEEVAAVSGGLASLKDMEKVHIAKVLESLDWNISRAAEVLEIDRVTLYNKIKKYGLREPPE